MDQEEQSDPPWTTSSLRTGDIFAEDFRVVRLLQTGGMGAVYVAEQISTGRQRALKLLAPRLSFHAESRRRFVQEAHIGAMIDSVHVVEVVTAGVDAKTEAPYLVMELLTGEDLGDCMTRREHLPASEVRDIFVELGDAMEQAHQKGIVHRDLKPENIFLAETRKKSGQTTVKVLDFGVAKVIDFSDPHKMTQPVGSPLFMAAEQTDPLGHIGPESDVWSMGLLAFFLLTGKSYWLGGDRAIMAMLLKEICIDPLVPASERAYALGVESALPQGFDGWFARCVNRDPSARWPTGGPAAEAFCALIEDVPASATPATKRSVDEPRRDSRRPSRRPSRPPSLSPKPTDVEADFMFFEAQPDMQWSSPETNDPVVLSGAPPVVDPKPTVKPAAMPPAVAPSRKMAVGAAVGLAFLSIAIGTSVGTLSARHASPGEVTASPVSSVERAAPASSAPTSPRPAIPPTKASAAREPVERRETLATAKPTASPVAAPPLFTSGRCHDDRVEIPARGGEPAFCMDRNEATVADYEACMTRGGCKTAVIDVGRARTDARATVTALCNAPQGRRAYPMNCVEPSVAEAFCAADHARLPTVEEWRHAARVSMTLPPTSANLCDASCDAWAFDAKLHFALATTEDDGFEGTAPVGSFKELAPLGIFDLAGNVAELATEGEGEATTYLALGGSFLSKDVHAGESAAVTPAATNLATVGFRCVSALP